MCGLREIVASTYHSYLKFHTVLRGHWSHKKGRFYCPSIIDDSKITVNSKIRKIFYDFSCKFYMSASTLMDEVYGQGT